MGNFIGRTLGGFLVVVGLLMVMGSPNDCDGACMDQANTIGEMLAVAGFGFACMIIGYFIFVRFDNDR
jgi:hypothetical protein